VILRRLLGASLVLALLAVLGVIHPAQGSNPRLPRPEPKPKCPPYCDPFFGFTPTTWRVWPVEVCMECEEGGPALPAAPGEKAPSEKGPPSSAPAVMPRADSPVSLAPPRPSQRAGLQPQPKLLPPSTFATSPPRIVPTSLVPEPSPSATPPGTALVYPPLSR
jgi:hypothetical protein